MTARDGSGAPLGRPSAVQLDGLDQAGKPKSVAITDQGDLRMGLRSTFWKPRFTAPTITGPATAGRGRTVTVSGAASPGVEVDVWFHRQGATGYSKRRSVVAGLDGSWKATFTADLDYRVYGVSQGLPGALGAGQDVWAPRSVRRPRSSREP